MLYKIIRLTLFLICSIQSTVSCSEKKEAFFKESKPSFAINFNQTAALRADTELFGKFWDEGLELFSFLSPSNSYDTKDLMCARAYDTISTELVGLMLFRKIHSQNNTMCINFICVHPESQKKGIGSALMKEAAEHFKPTTVKLVSAKENSSFYEKNGFVRLSKNSIGMVKEYPKN